MIMTVAITLMSLRTSATTENAMRVNSSARMANVYGPDTGKYVFLDR